MEFTLRVSINAGIELVIFFKEDTNQYIQFVSEGIGKASIMKEVKAQCILGTDEFLAEFEDYLTGLDKIPEFSKNQRYLNRPSLEKIFSKCNKSNRAQRDKLVKKSVLEYGYSQKEVAYHLGLHFTTISWIMNRDEKH